MQNNVRELINLLSFLEPEKFDDKDELERKYTDMSKDKVQDLHALLRPHILRRTRDEVLKLPPMVSTNNICICI